MGHYEKLRGTNVVCVGKPLVLCGKTIKLLFLKFSAVMGGLLYIFRPTDKSA
jgi:hypothetical protein